ncbi:MAG: GTPase ObgE [Deltaproteobacteria bacterium]|nr:GTPase ObgE [Deltaproteobacteria bacterium]
MQFIDEARIFVQAGRGGDGCAAFRRESRVPRGGPAGGDGGNGGSVVLVADPQLATLLDFKFQQHHRAPDGEDGRGKDQYGAAGADLVVRVPAGTVVRDNDGTVRCDRHAPGQRFVVAAGGRGGRGNIHFATSTNQAPRRCEPGGLGGQRWIRLELKLLADVGIVGYPNVGKSTLIARVSRARPKVADYPFTTLTPNLGVVQLGAGRTFVLADVPGLIAGAAEGAGLGLRFLRHVERTRALIHVVEVTGDPGRDPLRDYLAVRDELGRYDAALLERPEVVALSKLDLPEAKGRLAELKAAFAARGIDLHGISAATGEGVDDLLEAAWVHVARARAVSTAPASR